MLIIISPAKTLNFTTDIPCTTYTVPKHLNQSEQLVRVLEEKNPDQLSKLMGISSKLSMLNYQRYKQWHLPFTNINARQAAFVFKGEVYTGLDINRFSEEDLEYSQKHLRILSGLYGVLRPLDLIQPYRLEMGIKLKVSGKKNLYDFWDRIITNSVLMAIEEQQDKLLVNLASSEYFKSIHTKELNARIITPVFKDFKNGSYKFLSTYGKKARGMMTRFILQNRLKTADGLKLFEEDGYFYNENFSTENTFVFTRN